MINMKATGLNIRLIMDAKGVTVKDVQEYLHLESVQAIYKWLYGKSLPTVENLYLLAQLLEASMDELIVGDEKH